MAEQPWFVYLLLWERNTIYTGITPVLAKRMRAHAQGTGAKFTRMNRPIRLLAAKVFGSRSEACRLEREIKAIPASAKAVLAKAWVDRHPVPPDAQQVIDDELARVPLRPVRARRGEPSDVPFKVVTAVPGR